jgi:hypothetical protein
MSRRILPRMRAIGQVTTAVIVVLTTFARLAAAQ